MCKLFILYFSLHNQEFKKHKVEISKLMKRETESRCVSAHHQESEDHRKAVVGADGKRSPSRPSCEESSEGRLQIV